MGQRYRIYVEDTNISFCCAGDEAVLKAMIRAGKGPLRHGCCGGGCGVCRMKIVSGEWAGFK
ncbi:MAG: 2Fe-2S iron-sulfur cluster binding domain-containing protein, partial [Treponema sp.]|nr:2Fe-2S iron-sulfur cluster binding domain-containing protein [Treponema sp.]